MWWGRKDGIDQGTGIGGGGIGEEESGRGRDGSGGRGRGGGGDGTGGRGIDENKRTVWVILPGGMTSGNSFYTHEAVEKLIGEGEDW